MHSNLFLTFCAILAVLAACDSKNDHNSISSESTFDTIEEQSFIQVLGTTQDGGSPHTGCKKKCCATLFNQDDHSRKVVSLGLIAPKSKKTWLFEATPDLPIQMQQLQSIFPSTKSIPDGIFLTHAHIGHYTGLMFLGREVMNAPSVPTYCLQRMKSFLENNGPWSQLVKLENIDIQLLKTDSSINIDDNISVKPLSIPHRDEFSETAGYVIQGPNKSALFIPDIDKWEKWEVDINQLLYKVDYAFLDATFYDESEIPGRKMSEIPHPFVVESIQRFSALPDSIKSRVNFIHMNHTNPLLDSTSVEFETVKKAGYSIAKIGDRYFL